jgi:8-oxo-dGTP pyrophosphatase MutT (NUDIX family)
MIFRDVSPLQGRGQHREVFYARSVMGFTLLDEEIIFRGRIFDLARVRFRLPNGNQHTYDLVKHHGAVTILPVDDQGRIWFVRQFRIGAQENLLELPAGLLEEGESPEESAYREIQEEVGMAASSLKRLGEFYMVPGYSTEKLVAFLATGLSASQLPTDEDEFLEREAIPVKEVYERIARGEIRDGKTIATLLLAQPYLTGLTDGPGTIK